MQEYADEHAVLPWILCRVESEEGIAWKLSFGSSASDDEKARKI